MSKNAAQIYSFLMCLLACSGCHPKMVELQTDLPLAKEERPQELIQKSGESLFVPKGTKLLSRGVEVTSSDNFPIIGNLEMITDGNKEASDRWSYSVELMDGLQWVQIDLGKTHDIYAILVWHYYRPEVYDYLLQGEPPYLARVYQDVVVQISNDLEFQKNVIIVFNNDQDNSSRLGKGKDDTYIETSEGLWIDAKGVSGRYVRLYSNGHKKLWSGSDAPKDNPYRSSKPFYTMNHYIEVEVYGK